MKITFVGPDGLEFDSIDDFLAATMRDWVVDALRGVTCPEHGGPVEAVKMQNKSADSWVPVLTVCCDALMDRANTAIEKLADEE